jgi:hypothetical protein
MALYRHIEQNPPGGWRYRQEQSKFVITGESYADLLKNVIAHRKHKGFEPTDSESVGLEIQRQICVRLSRHECKSEGPSDNWTPIPSTHDIFNIESIRSFSASAWEWLKDGGSLVDEAEADRRAEICRACPANSDAGQGCMKCHLAKVVGTFVPEKRKLPGLTMCIFCGCDLRAKVLMPDSVVVKSDQGRSITYPSHCWQREIIDAHKSLPISKQQPKP